MVEDTILAFRSKTDQHEKSAAVITYWMQSSTPRQRRSGKSGVGTSD
jgi:hypothetical protein